MANERIKETAKKKGVRLWEVADRFGMVDSVFSRKLRKELSPEQRKQALQYIDEIAASR